MVAAQHAHLRAAPRAGRLDGLAGPVEHLHVAHRPGRARACAADPGAARADAREVVADAAALAHGLGGLRERDVDAGIAIVLMRNGVADGLHEAVDQSGREVRARGRLDAAGGQEAALQRTEKPRFPVRAFLGLLGQRQGPRDAPVDVGHRAFVVLGVFLQQHFFADGLRGQGAGRCGVGPGCAAGAGHGGVGLLVRRPVYVSTDAVKHRARSRARS